MSSKARTCLALVSWASGLLVAVCAGGAEPDLGPPFPRIANIYGTTLTANGAAFHGEQHSLADVARYDLLVGVRRPRGAASGDDLFREQLEKIKKLNAHLIAVHFACSAPYTHIAPPADVLTSRKPGQALPWLVQVDGQPIAGWPGTYMLNLAFPNVIEWLAQQTVPAVKTIGYDGVFIDCMGPQFDRWACEIATGKAYTVDFDADGKADEQDKLDEVWGVAKTKLARRVRELIGPKAVFMANQAGPSTYEQLNGIYLEDYIDAVIDGRMAWETVLEKYLHWTRTPRQPNVTVLGCGSGVEPPFEAFKLTSEQRAKFLGRGQQRLQRMRFGLATALMGDGYYSFDLHTRWRGQYWWYPEFDAPLGYPKGPCERHADGTWRREFDGGTVVVNPTRWDVRLEFDRLYHDVSSDQIDRRFAIPRLDGRIFVPSTGPRRPGTLAPPKPLLTPTGPAGTVQRDAYTVLRDGRSMAVLLGDSGAIESLCCNGQELIDSIATVIVADDRWRNFDTKDLHREVAPDGTLTLTGARVYGPQIITFTQRFHLADGHLKADYRWRAQTPLQVRAFRQGLRLPPRVFGGSVLRIGSDEIRLPKMMADKPNIAQGITTAALPIGDRGTLTIRLPQAAQLLDDRHYNGSGYLLSFYPVAGQIPAAKEWSYHLEISAASPAQ